VEAAITPPGTEVTLSSSSTSIAGTNESLSPDSAVEVASPISSSGGAETTAPDNVSNAEGAVAVVDSAMAEEANPTTEIGTPTAVGQIACSTNDNTGTPTSPSSAAENTPEEALIPLEGITDPKYLCINSYLPLSETGGTGGTSPSSSRRPVRMHISRSLEGKPPKTEAQMNREDASLLHWQFVFEALRHVFCTFHPEGIFIFQQSCGSGTKTEN
jgi:hypothetical protein